MSKTIRQVHLDFHTSPLIPGVGSKFSKENFKAALKKGNVDSITVFAKCHHSMCYYPTKIGTMHPHLDFDLTGAMVEAAHEIGVKAPVYITAGWSEEDAKAHPEWKMRDKNGEPMSFRKRLSDADENTPLHHVPWEHLCLAPGEYAEHIYAITEEICRRYSQLDGLFYDICVVGGACYCENCKKGMKKQELDPENEADVKKYYTFGRREFMRRCNEIMKKHHPDATIFFNSGGADIDKPQYHEFQSHFEMEDLPTAWGGYDKMPIRAKALKNRDKHVIGMTGKFHLDWGEFGGFKSGDALKYEIATMALYGAGGSIGDHMHPDGEMEMQTYENIGKAYDYLEKIAPYCYGGDFVADIGVYLSPDYDANEGLSKILLENQIDFDVINNNNFEEFGIVIIPEKTVLDDEAVSKLKDFLDKDGKLLFMADALVKDGKFQLDLGFEYIGPAQFDCDYIVPCEKKEELPNAPMLCNYPGHRIKAMGAQVLAEIMTPYFSRTYGHFCGHKNTPHNKDSVKYPAITQKGNVVYLSHPLPRTYMDFGSIYQKRYFMLALGAVYDGRLKTEGLGSMGRLTALHQEDKNRYCINMTYASPVKRGCAEIIEDIMPIYNIGVILKTDKKVKRVYLPLSGDELKFTATDGEIGFILPKLVCHETIVVEY